MDRVEVQEFFGKNIPEALTSIDTQEFIKFVEDKDIKNVQSILELDLYKSFSTLLTKNRYDLLAELLNYNIPYYDLFHLAIKLYRHHYLETKSKDTLNLIKQIFRLPNFMTLEGRRFPHVLQKQRERKDFQLEKIVTELSNYSSPDTENKNTTLIIEDETYKVRLRMSYQTEYKAMYDVFEKWDLVLPVDLFAYRLDYVTLTVDIESELTLASALIEHDILNSFVIPCTVGNYDSQLEAYLTRSVFSLRDEGVYVILGSILSNMPLESVVDYKSWKEWERLLDPLLVDIGKWKKSGIRMRTDNIAFIHVENSYYVRLFASTFDCKNKDLCFDYSFTSARRIVEFAITIIFEHEYRLADIKVESVRSTKDYTDIRTYFLDRLTSHLNGQKKLTVEYSIDHGTLDGTFNVQHPRVSKKLEKRDKQLSIAVLYPPNKRLAVEIFFLGFDIFYNNGSTLLTSIQEGDDYLLRYVSNRRLEQYMDDPERAYKLISTAAHACSINSNAFIFILTHDKREGRERSISYRRYLGDLMLKDQPISLDRNTYVERNLYIQYKGPRYERLL